jgi:glycosyltransferase
MKVSIITVCFNSVVTIEDTIKSVITQKYDNIEYVIVDGGSIDGTLDILAKYKTQISKLISEPDKGVYDAMNKGLQLATGDCVVFLNADDFYTNANVVSSIVEIFKNSDVDAVYGDIVYVDKDNINKIVRYWKTGEYKKGAFFHGWVIPHPAFFCKKILYEKYGYFRSGFKIAADFELMLRFIEKHKIKIAYLPEILVKMRTGGKANVLSGIIRGNREIIQSFSLNGFKFSPSFFVHKPIAKISQLFRKPK